MKILEYHERVNKNHGSHRISCDNHANHENQRIEFDNKENHKNLRNPTIIIKIMKI